ncbi:hypothetical protein R0J91_14755, partial [Micrococcus sp. SIMBA_131]
NEMNLTNIQTERRNQNTLTIDQMTTFEILHIINQEDHVIPKAVNASLPIIEQLVDQIVEAFQRDGRLRCGGAGTSGRLGWLEGSGWRPRLGAPCEQWSGG